MHFGNKSQKIIVRNSGAHHSTHRQKGIVKLQSENCVRMFSIIAAIWYNNHI